MMSFIKECGSSDEKRINDLMDKFRTDDSLLFCVYTTKFSCTDYRSIQDISHALEIRLFNETGEFKAVRTNIGKEFSWRYITDDNIPEDCIYDEIQYIDAARNDSNEYIAIGGGHYEMPSAGYSRVKIRHYGEYNENDGMFSLKDFRLVQLMSD